MPEAAAAISLSAAFLAGLAGSGHCFAMCGGVAAALGLRARSVSASRPLIQVAASHAGRLSGYTAAGALAGLLGTALQAALPLPEVARALRVASGALLMLIAVRVLFAWNPLRWLESLGARFWRLLQPLARFAAGESHASRALLLGFLWGWLPCGLVYSTLLFAALSGAPADGAAIMFAFGLGTMPSMVTSSLLASKTLAWSKQRWPRLASGVLLIACGAWLAGAALQPVSHGEHAQDRPSISGHHGNHGTTVPEESGVHPE